MSPRAQLLTAWILCISTGVAFGAQGEERLFAPVAWGGLAVGALFGTWTGLRDSHPGVGLAWAFGILAAGLVIWAAYFDELVMGLLMYPFLVPFLGAIPLAISFIITYLLFSMARHYLWPKSSGDQVDEH
jgi:hypothetical protein